MTLTLFNRTLKVVVSEFNAMVKYALKPLNKKTIYIAEFLFEVR